MRSCYKKFSMPFPPSFKTEVGHTTYFLESLSLWKYMAYKWVLRLGGGISFLVLRECETCFPLCILLGDTRLGLRALPRLSQCSPPHMGGSKWDSALGPDLFRGREGLPSVSDSSFYSSSSSTRVFHPGSDSEGAEGVILDPDPHLLD